jgi:hypothetical protein
MNSPGWKEELASVSEAVVKADRDDNITIEELTKKTTQVLEVRRRKMENPNQTPKEEEQTTQKKVNNKGQENMQQEAKPQDK